jgi:DNA-binding MarR family transcriptional regulator
LTSDFADLLRRAASVQRLRTERILAEFEVTPAQFAVLTIIVETPAVSNADVARIEGLTPQTISVIVANLIRSGAVMRIPHAVHGRIQQIEATPAGLDLHRRCSQRVEQLEQRLVRDLSQEQRLSLRRWLRGIVA